MGQFTEIIEVIEKIFEVGNITWISLFAILLVAAIVFLLRGIHIHAKRAVESTNFIVFCIPVIVWSVLLPMCVLYDIDAGEGTIIFVIINAMGFLIPPFLMLHIWSQVSYNPINTAVRLRWLALPVIVIALQLADIMNDAIVIAHLSDIINIYIIVVFVKSYLLCLRVFYQMPNHMRRSTFHILNAITTLVVVKGIDIYFDIPQTVEDIILAVTYIIVMYALFTAFFIANSSNVIVTSRDFVFANLSTTVITVSLKGSILDWNRKQRGGCYPLPDPKYKEPYTLYKQRIIDTCNGTISAHDDNIMNIKMEGTEKYFLFTWHEISNFGRKFGYLVEISEITKSYSKLRYFEEIAYYDTLTLLHSRNAYMEFVEQMVSPENMPLLIAVGDVNNLKKVNDSRGHLIGDKLLLTIACAVRDSAPEKAFLARIGGDELVMLLPNADENDAVLFTAAVTEKLNRIDDHEIGIPSIAWGYSVMHSADENYNDVFLAADSIMYEAKRKAREISISGIVSK